MTCYSCHGYLWYGCHAERHSRGSTVIHVLCEFDGVSEGRCSDQAPSALLIPIILPSACILTAATLHCRDNSPSLLNNLAEDVLALITPFAEQAGAMGGQPAAAQLPPAAATAAAAWQGPALHTGLRPQPAEASPSVAAAVSHALRGMKYLNLSLKHQPPISSFHASWQWPGGTGTKPCIHTP